MRKLFNPEKIEHCYAFIPALILPNQPPELEDPSAGLGEMPDELMTVKSANLRLKSKNTELEMKIAELEAEVTNLNLQVSMLSTPHDDPPKPQQVEVLGDEAARKRLTRICSRRAGGKLTSIGSYFFPFSRIGILVNLHGPYLF